MLKKNKLSLAELPDPRRVTTTNDYYDCPFCSDSRGRLGVLRKKGIYHCFNCGASGRLKDMPSVERFREKVDLKLTGRRQDSLFPSTCVVALPPGYRKIVPGCIASKYLAKRGINQELTDYYEIGYTTVGVFAHRIIVPIRKNGMMRYFVGRTYINDDPKYMNASAPKDDLVFQTFEDKVDTAVICEGIFDAFAIGRVMPSIALLGKTITPSQIGAIKRICRKAIVMLDSDAKVDGFKLFTTLGYHLPTRMVFIKHKDPGDMSKDQIKEALK